LLGAEPTFVGADRGSGVGLFIAAADRRDVGESRLENLSAAITGLSRFLEKIAPDLVAAVGKLKSDLKDEMGSIRSAIRTELEAAEAQHQITSRATASRISTLQTLVIFILVIVLTVLGFDFYIHFAR
jgi:hypothetical protein